MVLEAVWLKDGKEVAWVDPVVNIVCYEDMKDINDIEVDNGHYWYNAEELGIEADDFIIRIKKD